jgi:hypothetical protein
MNSLLRGAWARVHYEAVHSLDQYDLSECHDGEYMEKQDDYLESIQLILSKRSSVEQGLCSESVEHEPIACQPTNTTLRS